MWFCVRYCFVQSEASTVTATSNMLEFLARHSGARDHAADHSTMDSRDALVCFDNASESALSSTASDHDAQVL